MRYVPRIATTSDAVWTPWRTGSGMSANVVYGASLRRDRRPSGEPGWTARSDCPSETSGLPANGDTIVWGSPAAGTIVLGVVRARIQADPVIWNPVMRPDSSVNRAQADDFGWRALPRLAQAYVGSSHRRRRLLAAGVLSSHVARIRLCSPYFCCRVLPDVGVEGQSANSVACRVDTVGVVCGRSDGAAAARAATGNDRGDRRCVHAVHVEREAALAVYRTAFSMAAEAVTMAATGWRTPRLAGRTGPIDLRDAAQAARRRHRDVFLRQHRSGCRRHRDVPAAVGVEDLARQLSLERAELHGGRRPPARSPQSSWNAAACG